MTSTMTMSTLAAITADHTAAVVALSIAVAVLVGVTAGLSVKLRRRAALLEEERQQHRRAQDELTRRRDEIAAQLGSMVESVIAVDLAERLISLNAAAARLLKLRPENVAGKPLDAVILSEPLRRVLRIALQSDAPVQADVELRPLPGTIDVELRLFLAQGTALRDRSGARLGAQVVLHDVTRLRKLETVRRDFVTNASHEIKTPVTAIKAAAETLLDSGGSDPEADEHFLQLVLRQANRLQSIVEDMLTLARLEQDPEHQKIALEEGPIADVIRSAVETCRATADEKRMQIEVVCPPQLRARTHAPLMEQAVVNLLENAIKYSPEGQPVRITAERIASEVVITVQDRGAGIAPEHLPRVFERFYRTDKARSRSVGGTGLGLAIVRHIALAHGGRVTVDSAVGVGSTFRIHLPSAHPEITAPI